MGGLGKVFSKIGSVVGKVDPLRGGDAILEKVGLPTLTGQGSNNILDMGATAAQKASDDAAAAAKAAADQQAAAQAAAAQQAQQQNDLLNAMNKNYATDLTGENKNLVIAGGTADAAVESDDSKKKRTATGLSSSLGINV